MSIVKDMSLAESGRTKIQWVRSFMPALSAIVKLFSKDGDKVLIQTPVYSEFYDVVEAWGRTVVENQLVEENGHWHIDFEDFAAKVKECSIFLLCNLVLKQWNLGAGGAHCRSFAGV